MRFTRVKQMKQTTEELKAIIESALEGATHVDGQTYLELTTFQTQMYLGMWVLPDKRTLMVHQCIKSLDDIREIIELRESMEELEANQAKLDLNKIKADAIREAVKLYKNKVFDGCDIYSDGLLDYADKLEQRK